MKIHLDSVHGSTTGDVWKPKNDGIKLPFKWCRFLLKRWNQITQTPAQVFNDNTINCGELGFLFR